MKKIENSELRQVIGGSITLTATFINAFCRMVDFIFEVGQNLGSSIRRNIEKSTCPIK